MLVDEDGFDRLTLTRIAQRLNVRAPSLYNHVAGLEDVQRAVAMAGMAELATVLTRAAVGRAGDDAVRAQAQGYRTFERPARAVHRAAARTTAG